MINKLASFFEKVESKKYRAISFNAEKVTFAFYCLVFLIFQVSGFSRIGQGIHTQSWVGILNIFSFFPPKVFSLEVVLAWFNGSLLLGFFFPGFRVFRLSVFFSLIAFLALFYSYGKINNNEDIIIAIAFAFIFFSKSELNNKKVVLAAQTMVLTHYFAAGVWKVIDLATIDWSQAFNSIAEILPIHFAHTISEGRILSPTQKVILENPWLSAFLWLATVAVEVGSFLPIVSFWLWKHWWKLLILLHLGTIWVIGIDFYPTPLFIVFIFAIAPWLGKEGSHPSV